MLGEKSMRNYTRYSDPGMDKALEGGRLVVDQTERLKHYSNVNNILARDVVYHFLHYYTPFMLTGKNVEGIPRIPDGLLRSGFVRTFSEWTANSASAPEGIECIYGNSGLKY